MEKATGGKMIEKIIIKPEHFERIGTATNCHPIYKIHLQHFDKLNKQRAADIVKQAGGVISAEWGFAEFTTIYLTKLCKSIEQIANNLWYCYLCGAKPEDIDKMCFDGCSGICAILKDGNRIYYNPENRDDLSKMHTKYGGKEGFFE